MALAWVMVLGRVMVLACVKVFARVMVLARVIVLARVMVFARVIVETTIQYGCGGYETQYIPHLGSERIHNTLSNRCSGHSVILCLCAQVNKVGEYVGK